MAERASTDPVATPGAPAEAGAPRVLFGRRRSFVVNRRYQLRAGALAAAIVLVLLVFLNLVFWSLSARSGAALAAEAPELAPLLRAQDRVELFLVALASLVFLVGCFLITVLETHRTAGAAYNVLQRLGEIERGHYGTRLRLRRGDHLAELEPAFNRMVQALRARVAEDVTRLEHAAGEIEGGTRPRGELGRELRELAARHRASLDGSGSA